MTLYCQLDCREVNDDKKRGVKTNNYIMCYYIIMNLDLRMLLQNILIPIMLLTSIFGTASALYYKNRLEEVTMQKHINDKKTMELVRSISALAEEIRIATYPTDCDALTKEIIGEECDLGNYMEGAGPELESQTKQLHILLKGSE